MVPVDLGPDTNAPVVPIRPWSAGPAHRPAVGLIFGLMERRSKMAAKAAKGSAQDGREAVRSPMSPSRRALVLNATFEPLGIVSSRRAVLLVLDTKAELVHTTDRVFRSERMAVPEPSVVRLVRYVHVPRHYRVAVNRRTVFARDGSRCQYCGSAAENLDHVIPRSKGGAHTWENVVAACRRCNTRKEDRLPHEVGMVLRSTPVAPRHRVQLLALCGGASEDWQTYLGTGTLRPEQLTA
jgi:5-methylcytosine-specific restriction endonuclease McrA